MASGWFSLDQLREETPEERAAEEIRLRHEAQAREARERAEADRARAAEEEALHLLAMAEAQAARRAEQVAAERAAATCSCLLYTSPSPRDRG